MVARRIASVLHVLDDFEVMRWRILKKRFHEKYWKYEKYVVITKNIGFACTRRKMLPRGQHVSYHVRVLRYSGGVLKPPIRAHLKASQRIPTP